MRRKKHHLQNYIEDHRTELLKTLRFYVSRAGLSQLSADELLHDVVVEALSNVNRFDPKRSPRAWLLGIAANLIKRRQSASFRNHQREPLIHDLHGDESLSEDELFDLLTTANLNDDPARQFEAEERIELLLSHISDDDREIIQLAILHELDGKALAKELGISTGAARVRLHRALNRLRTVGQTWITEESLS